MTEFAIPVSKIKRPRPVPKGRPVDPVAREEVARFLEGRAARSRVLIENLHRIQDRFGHPFGRAPQRARGVDEARDGRGV
jgi:formate dehydrogenase